MNFETRERIWTSIERLSSVICKGKPYGHSTKEILDFLAIVQAALQAAETSDKAKRLIDKLPEPTVEQVIMFEQIANLTPQILPLLIAKPIQSKLDALSKKPSGRKTSIPEHQYKEVCDEILDLIGTGCNNVAAKKRVALRRDVSVKTIDRIWSNRENYPDGPQMSLDSAKEILQNLFAELFSEGWTKPLEGLARNPHIVNPECNG